MKKRIQAAIRAFSIHFGISAVIAICVAFPVLKIWFPPPYASLSGGLHLFLILIAVDVISGPLLTAIVFNPNKPPKEKFFDFFIIGVLQLGALIYGLYAIAMARPVILAFETDRFVAVSANEIDPEKLDQLQNQYKNLSWSGPRLVGTRAPRNGDETLLSIEMSIQGIEPSARPDWWQDINLNQSEINERKKPLEKLAKKISQDQLNELKATLQEVDLPISNAYYLPLVSKKNMEELIIILNDVGDIVGFAPFNGFNE